MIINMMIKKYSYFYFYWLGTDLPDDDYTTLVPPVKQVNGNNRKLPQIPRIVEHRDSDSSAIKKGIFIYEEWYINSVFFNYS